MNVISQTNHTILFEEISLETENLITLIGDVGREGSLSDEKVKEIRSLLCVESFEAFLERFPVLVYSYFNSENQKMVFSLKRPEKVPESLISEIPLNEENDFLKMIVTLLDADPEDGSFYNVDFQRVLEIIPPRKVVEEIRNIRIKILAVFGQYYTLDQKSSRKDELFVKLNGLFQQAAKHYGRVLEMLPLVIEDIRNGLLYGGKQEENFLAFHAGSLNMDAEGEVKTLERSKAASPFTIEDEAVREALKKEVEKVSICR